MNVKKIENNSEHWKRLEQLKSEIDVVNDQIKSNFKTIKELEELKRIQLKEVKILYKKKDNSITPERFKEQKNEINVNIDSALNKVLEELTYNTSFIVAKYDEMATLKGHKKIRSLNKIQKAELKMINDRIKNEKALVDKQTKRILIVYKKAHADDKKIAAIKLEREKVKTAIERNHGKKAKHLEESINKSGRSLKYTVLATVLAIAVPSLLLTGLLLNYLVYFPKTHHGQSFQFDNTSSIIAFVISMIMSLLILTVLVFLIRKSVKRIVIDHEIKLKKTMSIGFVASFFDILGVGSFATSLGLLKATKSIDDDKMVPGTLNLAFCIPILMEGSFLVSAVKVDILTLVVLIVCAVIGSYLGAMIVNKVNTKAVKLCISVALFIAGVIMILTTKQVNVITAGTLTGLTTWKLGVAIIGFIVIGILMSFGVGSYAPSMAILGLLGMNAVAITPIMMCSCAFLMPLTSFKFYKDNNFLPKTSLTLMLGGVFGATTAFICFYLGIQIGLGMNANGVVYQSMIKWLTIAVMFYSSVTLFLEFLQLQKSQENDGENKKNRKRRPLQETQTKKEWRQEIKAQTKEVIKQFDHNDFDAKSIVEEESIPIESWVKNDLDKEKD